MKKINIAIFTLLICCSNTTLHAQIFSVAELGSLSIKSGTILSADQLQIISSDDYTMSDNILSIGISPTITTGIANISRVYKFDKAISSFNGQFKLNYLDNELNGLTESGLKFLYNNGTAWTVDNTSTLDALNNQVESSALNSVSIKELTVGKAPHVEVGTTFIIHANPNPSPTAFKVYVMAAGNELVDVLLTDLHGKIIKSIKVKPNESILLGDDLAAATYILIARQGLSLSTTRIVKL